MDWSLFLGLMGLGFTVSVTLLGIAWKGGLLAGGVKGSQKDLTKLEARMDTLDRNCQQSKAIETRLSLVERNCQNAVVLETRLKAVEESCKEVRRIARSNELSIVQSKEASIAIRDSIATIRDDVSKWSSLLK